MDIYECTNQRHHYRASMQSESIIIDISLLLSLMPCWIYQDCRWASVIALRAIFSVISQVMSSPFCILHEFLTIRIFYKDVSVQRIEFTVLEYPWLNNYNSTMRVWEIYMQTFLWRTSWALLSRTDRSCHWRWNEKNWRLKVPRKE